MQFCANVTLTMQNKNPYLDFQIIIGVQIGDKKVYVTYILIGKGYFGVIKLIAKLIIWPKTPKKPLADDGGADSSSQTGIFRTLFFTYPV